MVTDSSAAVHDQSLMDLLPATLQAVAHAWLAGGRPATQLVAALLEQLGAVPAHRQLLLLQSLADALPQVCRHNMPLSALQKTCAVSALSMHTNTTCS